MKLVLLDFESGGGGAKEQRAFQNDCIIGIKCAIRDKIRILLAVKVARFAEETSSCSGAAWLLCLR